MTGTRRWVWTMLLVGIGPAGAQESAIEPLHFWSFSSWLLDAVEEGSLSETSATQVARFLDTEGLPWSVETAYRIPGLTPSEQAWLMASEAWLHQVLERRHSRASSRGFDAMWRGQTRPTAEPRSMVRVRTEGLRVQWESFEQGSLSGSCSWKSGSSRWVLGAHQLMWGHGLTIPRASLFAEGWFRGQSEVRMAASPVALFSAAWPQALDGLAWMKQAGRIGLGASLSQNHASLWLQKKRNWMHASASAHTEGGVHAFGSEMRLVDGRWDVELAWAACLSLGGWLGKHRVAVRRAYNMRAMWQGVWIREGPQMDLRWFGTWKSQDTRALFQCQMSQRWERMKREQWTVRWLFQPRQGGPLRWSGTMDKGGHETSLRVRRDGWQMDGGLRRTPEAWRAGWGCTFHHEWGEGWTAGLGWLQSNGGGLNGRVLWRSMDRAQWVTYPSTQPGKMMAWVQGEFLNGWHLGVRGLWSPTQEEAFRLEWQISRER